MQGDEIALAERSTAALPSSGLLSDLDHLEWNCAALHVRRVVVDALATSSGKDRFCFGALASNRCRCCGQAPTA